MHRNHHVLRTLLCGLLAAVVAALAGSVPQAAGITVTFPTRLAAGPDYATDVLGDAWDMCNAEDISPFPPELVGFSPITYPSSTSCRTGGTTQLVNGAADSSVVFLHRGIYGIVNPGRNGINFPIDPSKYQVLSYKLNSSLAGQGPQLYWFHNPYQHPGGDALGVRYAPTATIAGTQIVTADLTQAMVAGGVPWTSGAVKGLRIDPNHSAAGQSAFFHWVRLTSTTAVQRITWSGGTGTATITVRDNSDGTALDVASVPSASFYDWNYGVLPPGSYTLTVTKPGGLSGTAAFTINHPPTIQVTDPSPTTGEDYATKVLGNSWNMSDPGDLQITGSEHTTAVSFSGGQATATNTTNDPNVTLNRTVAIDTTKYRYLTYRFQVDGAFGLDDAAGSVARILWGAQQSLSAANSTTSKDILVWPGMNAYTVDLASLSAAADGGLVDSSGDEPWMASPKVSLRFDPHEGTTARTFHIDDVKLTAKPVAAGSFTIRFAGGDADGDPTTVALYYDTDTNAANGKTAIASGLAMSAGQFGWNTNGVPAGDYYIYAEANDGLQTTGRYSEVPVQVLVTAGQAPRGDFDGDGRTDFTVFRPSDGNWYIQESSSNYTTWNILQWGTNGDVPVPGDYDGDGKTDIAVYRPSDGKWYVLKSSTNYTTWIVYLWGMSGDTPVRGDYDGDGKTDMAVYRPSNGTWYLLKSSTSYTTWTICPWGVSGDTPAPGDYDGDGKTDMAVYRPSNGTWYVLNSSTSYSTWLISQWGISGDLPVVQQ